MDLLETSTGYPYDILLCIYEAAVLKIYWEKGSIAFLGHALYMKINFMFDGVPCLKIVVGNMSLLTKMVEEQE